MSRILISSSLVLCGTMYVFAFCAADTLASDPKSEQALWRGEWKLNKFELRGEDGKTIIDAAKGTLVVVGDKVKMTLQIDHQKKEYEYSFHLNPNINPKEVDYTMADGSIIKGIYSIDGKTLTRCHCQPGEERPKDFTKGLFSEWIRHDP